jgi:predicted nucleic acid-binding protein
VSAFVDTNVLVRHATGDPPDMAERATAYLATTEGLLVIDLVVAEVVFVLQSVYRRSRADVAAFVRALVTSTGITTSNPGVLLRALTLYETHGLHFVDACLVASAEASGVGTVASFDKAIDRVEAVRRIEP